MKTIRISNQFPVLKTSFLLALVFVFFSCAEDKEEPVIIDDEPDEVFDQRTLIEKSAFPIGAAVKSANLTGLYAETVKTHYDQITAEYEMKMNHLWNGIGSYDWTRMDALVNFATTNNMKIHGHTLLWYSSYPTWFKNAGYDSAAFETHVKDYIETVVGRYKGKIISWDVANEIFNDDGSLRVNECPVFSTFNDPIAFYGRCFQYTHDADPDSKLFYNDYNVVLASGKRSAMKNMATRFKNSNIPIDGLGDQFHYMVTTNRETIRNGLADMASTGLLVHISELDIRINAQKSDNFVYTTGEQTKHAQAFEDIVAAFEEIPQNQKFAITTWGITDANTWLTGWWHPKEYPLLFDGNYNKKRTYYGFLDGLK